ncbi:MAG: SHOCT domain-containing protein [Acidimicrobiales bacterium]|nr:SHOCT domain-containing protein [Acidimicrobiales bacterium]
MGIWKASKKVMGELQLSGVRCRATVLKVSRGGSLSGGNDTENSPNTDPMATYRVRTTVQITTPQGETFECKRRLTFLAGGIPKPGDTVPVIYDPHDHSVVEVDEAAHLGEVEAALGIVTIVGGTATIPLDHGAGVGDDVAATLSKVLGFDPASLQAGLAHGEKVMADHLEQMKALHAQGILSDEQFEMIRSQMPGQS